MANEELIERANKWLEGEAELSVDTYELVSDLRTALEAAESRALAAEAKHGKTADSLRIERQGFNSRMNAIEKAHRILGAAIQDGIYPEMAGEREMFCSVDLKAKGPTRDEIHDMLIEHMDEPEAGKILDRLFPQEQEPK